MNKKLIIFLLLVSFVFGYAVFEAMRLDSKFAKNSFVTTGTIIKELPLDIKFYTFDKNTLYDLNGLLAGGTSVVIHFWATYCGPCKVEFPELAGLTQLLKNNKKIKFVLVAIDDDLKKAKKFLKAYNFAPENTIYLIDNNKEYRRLGTYKIPETFVFGLNNKIIKKFTGGQPWTQKYLVGFFQSL